MDWILIVISWTLSLVPLHHWYFTPPPYDHFTAYDLLQCPHHPQATRKDCVFPYASSILRNASRITVLSASIGIASDSGSQILHSCTASALPAQPNSSRKQIYVCWTKSKDISNKGQLWTYLPAVMKGDLHSILYEDGPMMLTSALHSQRAALMRFIGALIQKSYWRSMYEARFEVLTAELLKIQIPWDVTLCRLIGNTRRQRNILEEQNFYACVSFATCARPFIRIQEKSRITEQIFMEYYVYRRFLSQFVDAFHLWLNSNKNFTRMPASISACDLLNTYHSEGCSE